MNRLRRIYDALTRTRLEREASQAVHPADELRAQLGHDAVSQPLSDIAQLAGKFGRAILEGYHNGTSSDGSGAPHETPETDTVRNGGYVDISADNPHLGGRQE